MRINTGILLGFLSYLFASFYVIFGKILLEYLQIEVIIVIGNILSLVLFLIFFACMAR